MGGSDLPVQEMYTNKTSVARLGSDVGTGVPTVGRDLLRVPWVVSQGSCGTPGSKIGTLKAGVTVGVVVGTKPTQGTGIGIL